MKVKIEKFTYKCKKLEDAFRQFFNEPAIATLGSIIRFKVYAPDADGRVDHFLFTVPLLIALGLFGHPLEEVDCIIPCIQVSKAKIDKMVASYMNWIAKGCPMEKGERR